MNSNTYYQRQLIMLSSHDKPVMASQLTEALAEHNQSLTVCKVANLGQLDIPHKVFLIDFFESELVLAEAKRHKVDLYKHDVIIINGRDSLPTDNLLRFGCLKGFFQRESPLSAITHGISNILNNKDWLPRQIASQLLYYYRESTLNRIAYAKGLLTAREQEVLECLGLGETNSEISDKLYISEHTVKTHIHHIYKKIDVGNRTQAMYWARNNLH
ncbi:MULTISPECIES: response regulator transcription factor [unclassified Vibrio]|uniref:Response regulator transcription factor n=1 Tax=Vibrio sp. HB236076 TaxID=3232307 RepID=A0AB39HB76_9VIBR|nr:response regulator transcription factor [Vibrio sp. HB161653]MDP5254377.1 response regulator transcription factor [Vibrio sp. HB161653]